MPASMATKLGIQFARFAQYTAASAATNNAGTHGLRGAFANASSGPAPAFAPGLSSSGSASAHSTGIGGAKFQAGKGAHSSFQNSGRTLANANASSANDGNTTVTDEDDDLATISSQGPAQIHRPFFQERRESIFQQGLRARLIETTSTLHLILPSPSSRHVSGARSISSSTSQKSPAPTTLIPSSVNEVDNSTTRPRSLSTSASQTQDTITSDTSFISQLPPLAPPDGGLIEGEQNESLGGFTDGRGPLGRDAAVALEQLKEARRSGKIHLMQSSVDIYKQSQNNHFSTAGFNIAMQIVLDLDEKNTAERVLGLYEQMLDANCPPNKKTYAYLIRALCYRDYEQFKAGAGMDQVNASGASDDDYRQVLAFMDVVHTAPFGLGFPSLYPYNHVLRSCAHRGDTEAACSIIDRISANKSIIPNAWTFIELLNAFRRRTFQKSSAAELSEEEKARNIQACEQIFSEFEVFRNSEGWSTDPHREASVWNAMISIYIHMGSPHKGIELLQKMLDAEPISLGKQIAPHPNEKTAPMVIHDLVAVGDVEGGLEWLERILTLNRGIGEGQESVMPLPNGKAVYRLFKEVMQLALGDKAKQSLSLELLPLVIKANHVLTLLYDRLQDTPLRLSEKDITSAGYYNGNWRSMVSLNSTYGSLLIKEGMMAEANTLADLSQAHIKQQFDLYADELSFISLQDKYPALEAQEVVRIRKSVRAILNVTRLLLSQSRYRDAAVCFSYAIAAWPPEQLQTNASPLSLNEVSEVSLSIMGFTRKAEQAQTDHRLSLFASLWGLNTEADLKMHLQVALTLIIPAIQQRMHLPYPYKMATKQLYLAARQQSEGTGLEIDTRGWGYLIEALISEGFKKEIDIAFLEALVNDLAALSETDRDQLSLQVMIANLPSMIGPQKALQYLHRIRPAIQMEVSSEETALDQGTAESTVGSATDEAGQQSATEAASPPSTATSIGSPETASEYNSSLSYALPAIVTIDADLGQALRQAGKYTAQKRMKGARGPKGSQEQLNAARLQPLYERLTKSIQEEGVYPSPDGICELMNQFGRIGAIERLKELYLIGCHVVAALGGDPDWQVQSWYELEDTMTAALAHGGDHRLANAHRITLLQAGLAPKADTYAALITVIRDTTDDVMVAEELFEESQRLGVSPTLFLYNTVLSKLSRARKAERAMQLFDEMRNRGVQPSSITYGAVLNACTRTGDEVNAERFFAMMESDAQFRPQAPPYNTMLQFYTQTKPDRQKALFYYEKACQRNVEHTSHTYKLLLDMYGAIAPVDVQGIRNIFGKLIADNRIEVQGNHWASLIWAYGGQLRDLDKAMEIYKSIPTHVATLRARRGGQEPDALAFEALLGVCAEHKRMDLIEEQIREREEKGCELTAYVANVVIKAFATLVPDVGLERARQVFEKMQDPPMGMAAAGNHPLQRQHVSGVQREENLQVSASATGAQMSGFERLKREPSTFEAMIRAEMQHGNLEQATALIHRMQARGYPPIVVAHAQDILVQQPSSLES